MTQLGFIGGTGDLGKALAIHLAKSYDKVLVGSREKQKAEESVRKLQAEHVGREYLKEKLVAAQNREVAQNADIIIATLPAKHAVSGIKELVGHFRGNQILISTAAPTPKVGDDFLPAFGGKEGAGSSITKQIKDSLVLDTIKVATAFQTVPADTLSKEESFEVDVPITSEDSETYDRIADVVRQIDGLRPIYLGSLEVSGAAEGLTSLLLNIGKRNDLKSPVVKFMPSR